MGIPQVFRGEEACGYSCIQLQFREDRGSWSWGLVRSCKAHTDVGACFGSLPPNHFPQGLSIILTHLPFHHHPGKGPQKPSYPMPPLATQLTSCGAYMTVDRKE